MSKYVLPFSGHQTLKGETKLILCWKWFTCDTSGPTNGKFKNFKKSPHYIFLKFYMAGIQNEVKVIFIFQGNVGYAERNPLWTFLSTKVKCFIFLVFHISLFTLFFLIVLVLEPGVHCYFVRASVNNSFQYSSVSYRNQSFDLIC